MSEQKSKNDLLSKFSTRIEYSGWGIAEFSNPLGRIEGDTRVIYDGNGGSFITLMVDRLPRDGDGDHLFRYSMRFINGTNEDLSPPVVINSCKQLMETSVRDGTFSVDKTTVQNIAIKPKTASFYICPYEAKFIIDDSQKVKYLLLPLSNYVGHSVQFTYKGTKAFIQPLADYKGRLKQLEEEKRNRLITAIMVAELNAEIINFDNCTEHSIVDLLPLISLATGRTVGMTWIEFLDPTYGLIGRLHVTIANASFNKGIAAFGISTTSDNIGQLLTDVLNKNMHYEKRLYLNAAISQLVLGGYRDSDGNIEDRLSHLFRAIDALFRLADEMQQLYSSKIQTIQSHDFLDEKTGSKVIGIIDNAQKSINTLANRYPANTEAHKRLKTIVHQVSGAKVIRRKSFGDKLARLLDSVGFEDAQILNNYYLSQLTTNSEDWLDTVSSYRNKIMHEGWFDWRSDKPDTKELMAITRHLHDIGVRLILKFVGYQGKYTPSILHLRGQSRPLDWVKPTTTPHELGYDLI
jgi:hypothetical protein